MKKYSIKPKYTDAKRILVGNQDTSNEWIYLGRLAEVGQLVRVDFDLSLPHVVAIFGKRGSGKSFTLGSFLEGLCTQERKTSISSIQRRHAALLFDTLGIFQWIDIPLSKDSPQEIVRTQAGYQKGWDLENETLDVKIWSPRGFLSSNRAQNEFTVNCADFNASDWGYLFGVDILQDRMGQLLNDIYEKVVHEGWSDGVSNYPPMKRYAIEDLMECVQNDKELNSIYHSETKRAVFQQLSVYWRNPLFQPKRKMPNGLKWLLEKGEQLDDELKAFESKEGTLLSDLLIPGKLSILLLHKLSDELRLAIIVSLIRKIIDGRIDAAEMEKNRLIIGNSESEKNSQQPAGIKNTIPPTWIVADEAQNFLPAERKTKATDTLIKLVREGRNFGLSFMLTTQQPSAIDQRILAQVDTMIVHKLTVQGDIEYIRRNLKASLPKEMKYGNDVLSFEHLMRLLSIGQAIVSNTEAKRSFLMDVRPRISVHGGFGE